VFIKVLSLINYTIVAVSLSCAAYSFFT